MNAGSTGGGSVPPSIFDHRYRVEEMLGKGGMATVFAVVDTQTQERLALKALRATGEESRDRRSQQLFEREYHTLVQLAHPHIVRAFEYGLADDTPYYTMEVLADGDLRDRSPCAWHTACEMARDVCSALSLMHSRRLVYRDLGPRNVRCTADGHAKLIDFGALVEMGTAQPAVCTPPVAAPEVVRVQALDGRADLYALGATLYYLLTGHHAYPARRFAQLRLLWEDPPVPPSHYVSDVPPELDRLVLDLLQLDPQLRPASAAEVSQRLSAIAGLPADADLSSSKAYLVTPVLVGRERPLTRLRARLARLTEDRQGAAVLVRGRPGSGRTRFLDAGVLEANLVGLTVLRASNETAGAFGAVRSMAAEWLRIDPEVALAGAREDWDVLATLVPELAEAAPERPLLVPNPHELRNRSQRALRTWLGKAAEGAPVVWVFDDVEQMDPESRALAALLANDCANSPMLVLAASSDRDDQDETMQVFVERCRVLLLPELDKTQTRRLFASVFGEVPNLATLVERLHALARGNPRDLLRVAQHLVDGQLVRYEGGVWTLPERLDDRDLPRDMADAMRVVLERLSPDARALGATFALFPDQAFSFAECVALSGRKPRALVFSHLEELLNAFVAKRVGEEYQLGGAGWTRLLLPDIEPSQRASLLEHLSTVFDIRGDGIRTAQCHFSAGRDAEGLDVLIAHARESCAVTDRDADAFVDLLLQAPSDWHETYLQALRQCEAQGRSAQDIFALQYRMTSLASPTFQDFGAHFVANAERLTRDAGLDLFAALDPSLPLAERLPRALRAAAERHARTPAHDQLFDPQQAIVQVARAYVLAFGNMGNTLDLASWERMPSIEPLAPLSPAIAIVVRMIHGFDARLKGRFSEARNIYREAMERLEADRSSMEATYVSSFYSGLAVVLGILEAGLGLSSATQRIEVVEKSPLHEASGLVIRSLERLFQGDIEQADAFERERELRRLERPHAPAFQGLILLWNLQAHAAAADLTRVREDLEAIRSLAQQVPTWAPVLAWAEGEYERVRGDHRRALEAFDSVLASIPSAGHMLWVPASAARIHTLLAMKEPERAHADARAALTIAQEAGLGIDANPIRKALALAAAADGDTAGAASLIATVIKSQEQAGITGLHLGLAHECAARIAVFAGDMEAYELHAARCRDEYHRYPNRALSARAERLSREAKRQAAGEAPRAPGLDQSLAAFPSTAVESALANCTSSECRLEKGLQLMMERSRTTTAALFTWDDGELAMCARRGEIEDVPGLQVAVAEHLESLRDDEMTCTQSESEAAPPETGTFIEHAGSQFAVIVLSHVGPEGLVLSGAVVLNGDNGVSPHAAAEISVAMSKLLSDRGDLTTQLAWT